MSSRGSRLDVMETSKDWPGDDRSGGAERTRSGRMQIQTSVRPIAVVVNPELPERPEQMALVDHDDVVQAFPVQSPHHLSAIAFAFGALYGVRMSATPSSASLESKFLL